MIADHLDFYFFPGTCARVTHVMLEELGLGFTPRPISIPAGEHKQPGYLALNPAGKVPMLVANGRTLTETLAILSWLGALYPGRVLPDRGVDAFARAEDWSLIAWFTATVHPIFTRFRMPPAIVRDPALFGAVSSAAAPALADCFAVAAARLAGRDWFFDRFSAADAYLFWLWGEATANGFDGKKLPTLAIHHDRVAMRPAAMRAMQREAATLGELARAGRLPPPLRDQPPR